MIAPLTPARQFMLDAEPRIRAAYDYVALIAGRLDQAGQLDELEQRALSRLAIEAREQLWALEQELEQATEGGALAA